MKTRVCHITSVHSSWDTRILHRECASLAECGYEVILLVLNQESKVEKGVQIISVDVPIRGRLDRMLRARKAMLQKALELEAAIYHFHDPELLPLGGRLRKLGKTVIYDSHEHVPHQIRTKKYLPRWVRVPLAWLFERYENRMVSKMSAVVTATDLVRDRFLALDARAVMVNNYPRFDTFIPPAVEKEYDLTYVGLINEIRGIRELLDALVLLPDRRLCLVGLFETDELQASIEQHPAWSQVDYLGLQSREEVAAILSKSRLGIVTFLPAPNHNRNQPNKLFEYMAAGLPVVCSHFERWQKIVVRAQCGRCVDPKDPQAIAEGCRYIFDHPLEAADMGENSRQAMETHYNWGSEQEQLTKLYAELLATR
jgi:glycosyltransferase involved in cell wall biosynthesis